MKIDGITWQAGGTTDTALLSFLPSDLRELIEPSGGFILQHGAIHFRGCTHEPSWNSIRGALTGKKSIHMLYQMVDPDDIPFAQDQVGDQYLLRGDEVFHLNAETGEMVKIAKCLAEFMDCIQKDIESYLNIALARRLEPGDGLLAYPPFCTVEATGGKSSLKPVPFDELLDFHSNLARHICEIPDGGQFKIELTD